MQIKRLNEKGCMVKERSYIQYDIFSSVWEYINFIEKDISVIQFKRDNRKSWCVDKGRRTFPPRQLLG